MIKLFRRKNYAKSRRKTRVFIRRSKINQAITNNSFSYSSPQTTQLKHRRIRRKILDGAGDEKMMIPASSIERKHIDFTELEQIFDNALRNRLPLELYKQKAQTKDIILTKHESLQKQSPPKLEAIPPDTRIELSTVEPLEEVKCCLIYNIKQHQILAAIVLITFSALIGFFSVWIFVK